MEYRIHIYATAHASVVVDAESQEDAKDKVMENTEGDMLFEWDDYDNYDFEAEEREVLAS